MTHRAVFFVDRDGEADSIAADEFGHTRLARRLRLWHSDDLPETFPPGFDAAVDDREPPRQSVEPTTLFDGLAEYVAGERTATRAANTKLAEDRSARSIYQQGGDAIPVLDCLGDAGGGTYRFRVDLDDAMATRRDDLS